MRVHSWPLLFSLFLIACASAPRVPEYRFSDEEFIARNGQLRYKLPSGWINATNDSLSSTNTIWLVRSDFAATIAVKEVVIDAGTRKELQRSGLKRIAELTLALVSGEKGVSVTSPPQPGKTDRMPSCTYEYTTGNLNDRVRVMLIDTGSTLYEVNLLMTAKAPPDGVTLQEAFVRNLSW